MNILGLSTATTPLAYLATPYTNYPEGHLKAFGEAVRLTAALTKSGIAVFCPILCGHAMVAWGDASFASLSAADWVRINAPFMRVCDVMIVARMPGWDSSVGVAGEIAAFRYFGRPVFFCDPETLWMERG